MADDLTDGSSSLADHEAAHPVETPPPAAPAAAESTGPAPEDESASLEAHEAAFTERDDHGRFKSPRHRARSQSAGAKDVPRIAELTRRLRETEAERDRLKSTGLSSPSSAPTAPTPAGPPQPAPSRPAPAASFTRVPAAKDDPEPRQDLDPATNAPYDDFSKWVTDHGRWAYREGRRQELQQERAWQHEQQTQAETRRLQQSWQERVAAAKMIYPDFPQVALEAETAIPQGSLVDAWILEHKAGAHVLYHLQKSPADLQRILALPLMDQVEELTLLGQRLLPQSRTAAVGTGAAPAPIALPVPRPPTPVRTAPMRTGTELPGEDASLSDHEKAFAFKGNRRR